MISVAPSSAEELASNLREASARSRSIAVFGSNTKRLMAGPLQAADVILSTSGIKRVLQYEPNDLTVSVEAGMLWSGLQRLLARRHQMVALDVPFSNKATVGGVIASNAGGSLRCRFGTARDLVIGMQFAVLEGKLIRVGGMVVKNVAGLDIGKLMIGSFGTLAVITSVNFRLHATPEEQQTFLFSFSDLDSVLQKRNEILGGVLRPLALDLLSPAAAARFSYRGYLLALRAGGSRKVLARYARDLAASTSLTASDEEAFWTGVREFPAEFLNRQPGGIVVRVSAPLSALGKLIRGVSDPSISHAASGTTNLYFTSWQGASAIARIATLEQWTAVVEYAPDEIRSSRELWLSPPPDSRNGFDMMKRVKQMFDPGTLLNRSRLYGRL